MATIRYLVNDTAGPVGFYTEKLGFKLQNNFGTFALIAKDGPALWCADPRTSAAQSMPDGSKPVPVGLNRLVIEVDDVAGFVETLKAGGAKFRNEILRCVGGQQILLEDPSGNPIEFIELAENRLQG